MNIQAFHDAATGTFTYVVDDGHGSCAVVDPVIGFDLEAGQLDPGPVERVADWVRGHDLRVEWLLETHAHADHVSGASWLKDRLGGTVAVGAQIREVQALFESVFPEVTQGAAAFDCLLQPGERFAIGRLQAQAIAVPGHTPADLAYRVSGSDGEPDAVFVGDTLLMPAAGTARCDFPGGSAADLYRSVRHLLELPACTRLYVCHDYPAAGEAARCMATVAEHRAGNAHVRDGIDLPAFVALREARDATLSLPRLIIPALQLNLRAGRLPRPEANGVAYLRIPIGAFGQPRAR